MAFFSKLIGSLQRFFSPPLKTKRAATLKTSKPASKKKLRRLKIKPSSRPSSRPKRVPVGKSAGKPTSPTLRKKQIGKVTHYFSRIQVVVVKVTGETIRVGDTITIEGNAGGFTQKITSLQIESVDVKSARKGQLVGLKVQREAKEGDVVYLT